MSNCPVKSVTLQAGIHTGPCISGLITASGSANYTLVGEAVNVASILEKDGLPNCVHASKKTTQYLSATEFEMVVRTSYKLKTDVTSQLVRTCWVTAK